VALNTLIDRPAAPLSYYLWLLGLILPMWVGLLALLGAYGVGWTTRSRLWLVARVSGIGLLLLTAGLFLVKAEEVNRSVLGLFVVMSGIALCEALRARGVTSLVVTGTLTDICVLASIVGAFNREYRVTVAEDAVATLESFFAADAKTDAIVRRAASA